MASGLSEAIESATGVKSLLSTSDTRLIKDYCPVVEYGLVGQTMHQVDEHVDVAHLDALTDIYESVMERFFHR